MTREKKNYRERLNNCKCVGANFDKNDFRQILYTQRVPNKTTGSWITELAKQNRKRYLHLCLAGNKLLQNAALANWSKRPIPPTSQTSPPSHWYLDIHLTVNPSGRDQTIRLQEEKSEYTTVAWRKPHYCFTRFHTTGKNIVRGWFLQWDFGSTGDDNFEGRLGQCPLPPVIKYCALFAKHHSYKSATLPVRRERRRCRSLVRVSQHRAVIFR